MICVSRSCTRRARPRPLTEADRGGGTAVPHVRPDRLAGQRNRLRRMAARRSTGARSTTRPRSTTLLHAFERGINFVDTAELYGDGHSEEVIGEALRQWGGDKIYVATKVQPDRLAGARRRSPADARSLPRVVPAQRGRRRPASGSASSGIDLLQLHGWFPDGIPDARLAGDAQRAASGGQDRPDRRLDPRLPARGRRRPRPLRAGRLHPGRLQHVRAAPRATSSSRAGAATRRAFIARVPFDSGSLIGQLDRGHLCHLGRRLGAGTRSSGVTVRARRSPRRGAEEALRALLPDARRGGHAVRAGSPAVSTVIPGCGPRPRST